MLRYFQLVTVLSDLFGAWEFFQYYCLIDSSAYPVLPGICVFMSGSLLRPVYLLADAETGRLCHTRCPEKRRMSIRTASHSNFRCIETERKIIVGRHMRLLLLAKFDSNFFRPYDDKYKVTFLIIRLWRCIGAWSSSFYSIIPQHLMKINA